jgi:hypothetical protein
MTDRIRGIGPPPAGSEVVSTPDTDLEAVRFHACQIGVPRPLPQPSNRCRAGKPDSEDHDQNHGHSDTDQDGALDQS